MPDLAAINSQPPAEPKTARKKKAKAVVEQANTKSGNAPSAALSNGKVASEVSRDGEGSNAADGKSYESPYILELYK
jgi:hypothetical protein